MVGMPVEAFLRDYSLLLVSVLGFALGVGGIRHGNPGARMAGWWAIGLLLPLLVLHGYAVIRRSFLA
jgi:hypothetical protein